MIIIESKLNITTGLYMTWLSNDLPASRLNLGNKIIINTILITSETIVNTIDSDMNWSTSGKRREPTTFRRPTSRARLAERAVARFM
jgi:hypothetical protein